MAKITFSAGVTPRGQNYPILRYASREPSPKTSNMGGPLGSWLGWIDLGKEMLHNSDRPLKTCLNFSTTLEGAGSSHWTLFSSLQRSRMIIFNWTEYGAKSPSGSYCPWATLQIIRFMTTSGKFSQNSSSSRTRSGASLAPPLFQAKFTFMLTRSVSDSLSQMRPKTLIFWLNPRLREFL